MLISVCMIVRNEEKLLPVAVASTVGLADEIVVLDTGSEDKTIEVARELGAVVLTGGDRMHKGQSRNQAMAAATGDWVVILDADETIQDPVGLRKHLEESASHVRAYYVLISNGGSEPVTWDQLRIWKRGVFQYKYRAHEVPVPVDGTWSSVYCCPFVFEHHQPASRWEWKKQYTLDRLLLDVQENPEDGRPVFYLGRQYSYLEKWGEAKQYLLQYLNMAPHGHDAPEAWRCLAYCYGKLEDKAMQIRSLYQFVAHEPLRRDGWGELAELYRAEGDNQLALALLKCALELPRGSQTYIHEKWYGAHIYDLMALCLWKLERYNEGEFFAREAARLDPENKRLERNLWWYEKKLAEL